MVFCQHGMLVALTEFTFSSKCFRISDFLYKINCSVTYLFGAKLMFFCNHVLNFMHIRQAYNGKNVYGITFNTNCLLVLDFSYNIKSRDSSLQVRFFFATPIMLFCQHKMSLSFSVDLVLI